MSAYELLVQVDHASSPHHTDPLRRVHLLSRAEAILKSRYAVSEMELVRHLGLGFQELRILLGPRIEEGHIIRLTPIHFSRVPPPHYVFYRWRHADDRRHLWQQSLYDLPKIVRWPAVIHKI